MIGLRILQLVSPCDDSLATSAAANLMRWLRSNGHETALLTDGGGREGELRSDGFETFRYVTAKPGWWFGGRSRRQQRRQRGGQCAG